MSAEERATRDALVATLTPDEQARVVLTNLCIAKARSDAAWNCFFAKVLGPAR